MAFLFDTDAISEVLKRHPLPAYLAWLRTIARGEQFTSAVVASELFKGAHRPSSRRSAGRWRTPIFKSPPPPSTTTWSWSPGTCGTSDGSLACGSARFWTTLADSSPDRLFANQENLVERGARDPWSAAPDKGLYVSYALARERRAALVVATHDGRLAARANRILRLEGGGCVPNQSRSDLFPARRIRPAAASSAERPAKTMMSGLHFG